MVLQDFFLDLIFAPVERPAMGEAASSSSSSISPKASTKSTTVAGSETASSETAAGVTATGARHRRQLSSQEVDSALGPVASSGDTATAQQQQQREAGTAYSYCAYTLSITYSVCTLKLYLVLLFRFSTEMACHPHVTEDMQCTIVYLAECMQYC
jgi:hypothetical protein